MLHLSFNVSSSTLIHTNCTISPGPDNEQWALIVFYVVLLVGTVAGNVLVIAAFFKDPQLQAIANYWIVSLSLTDVILACTILPLHMQRFSHGGKWALSELACDLFIMFDVLSCTCSIYHLMLISLDRYLCVCFPIKYQQFRTSRRTIAAISVTWLFCAVLSSPRMFGWKEPWIGEDCECAMKSRSYRIASSLISFFIPLFLIMCMYIGIYRWTQTRQRRFHGGISVRTKGTSAAGTVRTRPTPSQTELPSQTDFNITRHHVVTTSTENNNVVDEILVQTKTAADNCHHQLPSSTQSQVVCDSSSLQRHKNNTATTVTPNVNIVVRKSTAAENTVDNNNGMDSPLGSAGELIERSYSICDGVLVEVLAMEEEIELERADRGDAENNLLLKMTESPITASDLAKRLISEPAPVRRDSLMVDDTTESVESRRSSSAVVALTTSSPRQFSVTTPTARKSSILAAFEKPAWMRKLTLTSTGGRSNSRQTSDNASDRLLALPVNDSSKRKRSTPNDSLLDSSSPGFDDDSRSSSHELNLTRYADFIAGRKPKPSATDQTNQGWSSTTQQQVIIDTLTQMGPKDADEKEKDKTAKKRIKFLPKQQSAFASTISRFTIRRKGGRESKKKPAKALSQQEASKKSRDGDTTELHDRSYSTGARTSRQPKTATLLEASGSDIGSDEEKSDIDSDIEKSSSIIGADEDESNVDLVQIGTDQSSSSQHPQVHQRRRSSMIRDNDPDNGQNDHNGASSSFQTNNNGIDVQQPGQPNNSVSNLNDSCCNKAPRSLSFKNQVQPVSMNNDANNTTENVAVDSNEGTKQPLTVPAISDDAAAAKKAAIRRTLTRRRQRQENRTARVVVIVIGCFVLFWAPFFILNVAEPAVGWLQLPGSLWEWITYLGYCNSAVNPIIYTCFNRTFRRAIENVIKCRRHRSRYI